MFTLFPATPSARPSSRRLRLKKPDLGVEQLDKRQVLSAAPTVDIPDSFVVQQRQTTRLDFGSTPFADIDSPGSKRMTVTVKADSGTLTASSGSGVRVTGKGATRVFTGSLNNLNLYFSGAGQVSYRNNSAGLYSLSVQIAEKVGRRTLSSSDLAYVTVTSPAATSPTGSSSTAGFPPQLGSTPSTSSLSTSNSASTTSWSSGYSSSPSTTSSWTSSPSTSSYSSYSYPSTSYSSYSYPSTSYSSYSYPSSSYSSYYPTTSWSSGYSSYPLTTSSWYSYPSSSTSSYYSTALNTAASNTQALLNLQSSYNQLQGLNSQLAGMGQSTYSMPSSVTNLLYGSSGSSGSSGGSRTTYTQAEAVALATGGYTTPGAGMTSMGTALPFANWYDMGNSYSSYAYQPYNSSYNSTYNTLQNVNSWLTGVYHGYGIYF